MECPDKVKCPECGYPMRKAGAAESGRKEYQRYKCNRCKRTKMNRAEPFIRKVKQPRLPSPGGQAYILISP